MHRITGLDRRQTPLLEKQKESKVVIRIASLNDLNQIDDIYNQAIDSRCSTGDTQYWQNEDRLNWYNDHISDQYPILIAEIDKRVIGWICVSPYRKGREGLKLTVEVSYYIHNDFKQKGVGSALLSGMIAIAEKLKYKTMIAIVFHSNTGSVKLLEKHGFVCWGTLPDVIEIDSKTYSHLYYGLKLH